MPAKRLAAAARQAVLHPAVVEGGFAVGRATCELGGAVSLHVGMREFVALGWTARLHLAMRLRARVRSSK